MANHHGDFIWYELLTRDADAAAEFYGKVIGWACTLSEQPGMDYHMLAMPGEEAVAGLMAINAEMAEQGARPAWLGYVGVDDVDAMAASVVDGGGAVHMAPQDIPGVGRFAFVADPQGAMLYVMRGTSNEESHSFSYDKPRQGHCAWNELATPDPEAAKSFYGQRFGWVKDGEMDMGPLGAYQFLRHAGRGGEGSAHAMLGAVMPMMPGMPMPMWTYYFRVPDIDAAVSRIESEGGAIIQPPTEIPGGEFSLVGTDPHGAVFGLVGGRGA